MKHLKTKLMFSALALACLGALTLQPAVAVKAEGGVATDANGLCMENGAAVCLSEGFSGIRWTTTVDQEWFENAGNPAIGVLVAPTSSEINFVDGEAKPEGVMDLAVQGSLNFSDGEAIFYSVVNYDKIAESYEGEMTTEAALEKAYALELTAIAYVESEGVCYYANMAGINTSRSARQVAIAAELSGEIDAKYRNNEDMENGAEKAAKAVVYYGEDAKYEPAVKSVGAVGTAVIDLENPTATVEVSIDLQGNTFEQAIIGAKSVTATYADGTLTITDASYIPTGEHYVTVFTNGGLYTAPIIGATKVLRTADDLKTFNAKGVNGVKSVKVSETTDDDGDGKKETEHNYYEEGYWSADQEQSGYYVLGQDIAAEGYVHGSKKTDDTFNDDTWNTAAKYKNMPIGLTGTFNGLGYAIKDMEIGSQREGFFGIVNGGTVKNVAFLDVKATGESKFVIANYIYKGTVENVYIRTDEYVADADDDGVAESMGFPTDNCSALANYATGNSKLRSLFIHYQTANNLAMPTGVMFTAYNDGFTTEDVYCVTDNKIGSSYTHALMYINNKEYATGKNYNNTKSVWLAENEISLTASDGTVYMFAPGEIEATLNDNGTPVYVGDAPVNNVDKIVKSGLIPDALSLKFHSDTTRARVVMYGAFRYNSLDALYTYNETYTNLANTGCWSLDENNQLVWGK